jgi:hypothetical protein
MTSLYLSSYKYLNIVSFVNDIMVFEERLVKTESLNKLVYLCGGFVSIVGKLQLYSSDDNSIKTGIILIFFIVIYFVANVFSTHV